MVNGSKPLRGAYQEGGLPLSEGEAHSCGVVPVLCPVCIEVRCRCNPCSHVSSEIKTNTDIPLDEAVSNAAYIAHSQEVGTRVPIGAFECNICLEPFEMVKDPDGVHVQMCHHKSRELKERIDTMLGRDEFLRITGYVTKDGTGGRLWAN